MAGIGAVLAFVVINLNVQVWQEETRIAEQRALAEDEAERQAALACDQLYDQIQDTAERNAEYTEAYVAGDGRDFERFMWKCSGEKYELEPQQLEDDYMRAC